MNGCVYISLHLVAPSLISVTAHLALLTFASERSLEAQSGIIYLQFARVKSEKNGKVENSRILYAYPDWSKRNFCHHISDVQGVFCCIPYEYSQIHKLRTCEMTILGSVFLKLFGLLLLHLRFSSESGILQIFAILLKRCDLYKFVLWCYDHIVYCIWIQWARCRSLRKSPVC